MNRIYWDIDKIASLTDHLEAATHSHGMIQFFLFLRGTPEMKVGKDRIHDRCLFVNVNVKHAVKFSDGLYLRDRACLGYGTEIERAACWERVFRTGR